MEAGQGYPAFVFLDIRIFPQRFFVKDLYLFSYCLLTKRADAAEPEHVVFSVGQKESGKIGFASQKALGAVITEQLHGFSQGQAARD